jgi:hypothetical protein
MQIHATNIQGLGASQVVVSFLDSCSKMGYLDNVLIYLPSLGFLSNYHPQNGKVIRYNRKMPNGISRLLECLFSALIFPKRTTIVLGDIPLRGIYNQIVLVHQPNLIYPKFNPYSSKGLNFRLNRFLFSINHKFAKKIIVQTGAMADDLIKSYPSIKNKIAVVPQPVPNWLEKKPVFVNEIRDNKMILFYPSAFYPHKKHEFLNSLNDYLNQNNINFQDIEVWVTLSDFDFENFKSIPFVKNLGILSSNQMNHFYKKTNALLFLSSAESYGLPLIEAVTLNLPILTVDLNYSRWICEETAYYFEPYSEKSFIEAILKLKNDLSCSINPNYSEVLKKFPESWDDVVEKFMN